MDRADIICKLQNAQTPPESPERSGGEIVTNQDSNNKTLSQAQRRLKQPTLTQKHHEYAPHTTQSGET